MADEPDLFEDMSQAIAPPKRGASLALLGFSRLSPQAVVRPQAGEAEPDVGLDVGERMEQDLDDLRADTNEDAAGEEQALEEAAKEPAEEQEEVPEEENPDAADAVVKEEAGEEEEDVDPLGSLEELPAAEEEGEQGEGLEEEEEVELEVKLEEEPEEPAATPRTWKGKGKQQPPRVGPVSPLPPEDPDDDDDEIEVAIEEPDALENSQDPELFFAEDDVPSPEPKKAPGKGKVGPGAAPKGKGSGKGKGGKDGKGGKGGKGDKRPYFPISPPPAPGSPVDEDEKEELSKGESWWRRSKNTPKPAQQGKGPSKDEPTWSKNEWQDRKPKHTWHQSSGGGGGWNWQKQSWDGDKWDKADWKKKDEWDWTGWEESPNTVKWDNRQYGTGEKRPSSPKRPAPETKRLRALEPHPPAEEPPPPASFAAPVAVPSTAAPAAVVSQSQLPSTREGWMEAQGILFPHKDPLPRPWIRIISKSTNRIYHYNTQTGQSQDPPK